jgi:hypothetical protein
MRLRTLATALVALLVLTGYVSAASCQYYDICQDSQNADCGTDGCKDQGDGHDTDGCQCLCQYMSLLSVDPTLIVAAEFDVFGSEYQLRDDRLVPGPVARIDHPPQLI